MVAAMLAVGQVVEVILRSAQMHRIARQVVLAARRRSLGVLLQAQGAMVWVAV